jgi:hypothetical protein
MPSDRVALHQVHPVMGAGLAIILAGRSHGLLNGSPHESTRPEAT